VRAEHPVFEVDHKVVAAHIRDTPTRVYFVEGVLTEIVARENECAAVLAEKLDFFDVLSKFRLGRLDRSVHRSGSLGQWVCLKLVSFADRLAILKPWCQILSRSISYVMMLATPLPPKTIFVVSPHELVIVPHRMLHLRLVHLSKFAQVKPSIERVVELSVLEFIVERLFDLGWAVGFREDPGT
jgi:hypothetical protein